MKVPFIRLEPEFEPLDHSNQGNRSLNVFRIVGNGFPPLRCAGMWVRDACILRCARAASILLTAALTLLRAAEEPPKKEFFLPKSPAAAAYVLGRLSNKELSEAPRSEFVYVALLQRQGLERKYRLESLAGLARIRNTDSLTELIACLTDLDKKGEASDA